MSVLVKAYLSNISAPEIRRFQIPVEVSTNYEYLRSKICNTFPSIQDGNFKLYWRDSDGEDIRFTCDDELMMALSAKYDETFRVYIKAITEETSSSSKPAGCTRQSSKSEPDGVPHRGILCDVCDSSIHGRRYKCVVCPDFDLCQTCEQTGAHSEHIMIRLVRPLQRPFSGMQGPWTGHFHAGGPYGFAHSFSPAGGGFWRNFGGCSDNNSSAGPSCCQQGEPACATEQPGTSSGGPSPNNGEQFLRNLGAGIASALGNIGVDVHCDIEHNGSRFCPQGRCHPSTTNPASASQENMETQTAQDETAASQSESGEERTQSTPHPTPGNESNNSNLGAESASNTSSGQQNTPPFGNGFPFNNPQQAMEALSGVLTALGSLGVNFNHRR